MLAFSVIAMFGIVAHVVHRWSDGKIETSVYDWFMCNPKSTVRMMMAVAGSLVLLVANDAANNHNDIMQVIAVFGLGYVGNSTMNKE